MVETTNTPASPAVNVAAKPAANPVNTTAPANKPVSTPAATPAPATAKPAPGPISPAAATNDKRMSEVLKAVGKLGEESAMGADSLPKLAFTVVKAASDGIINMTDKNKAGKDAAAQIYDEYVKSESKKAVHSKGGTKANVSKVRQLVAMGCMSTIDAFKVLADAMTARNNMLNEDLKCKAVYNYYIDVAREQLKQETPLTEKQLEKLALKPVADPKELEDLLKTALKQLEGLVTGENKSKVKDTDERTEAAFHAIKERLAEITTLRMRQEIIQNATKQGINLI